MERLAPTWLLSATAALAILPAAAHPADDDLRPGLVARYRSPGDPTAALDRVDPKPALYTDGSSLHPRLPPGPFEVTWTGLLRVEEEGSFSIGAHVCGELRVEIDGVVALAGRGEEASSHLPPGEALEREPGDHALRIVFRAPPAGPARLQLDWSGASFGAQALPPWRLLHREVDVTPAVRAGELVDRGRDAAARLGCARCHAPDLPGVAEPPPGPALAGAAGRLGEAWLRAWLDDPTGVRPGARMPRLFRDGRQGFVERWLVARHLARPAGQAAAPGADAVGTPRANHRMGRRHFACLGCAACHFLPDLDRAEQEELGRSELRGLGDRYSRESLAAFLADPSERYPDGRMPRLRLAAEEARDVAAYLLLWSKPTAREADGPEPRQDELDAALRRLGASDLDAAGAALIREKRCAACHAGLEEASVAPVPIDAASSGERGCLAGAGGPRFALDAPERDALRAFLGVAARERHPSPVAARGRLLARLGCVRCHQRDTVQAPPIERVGSTLGGAWLQTLPFQRTPRLTHALEKLEARHVLAAVRDGAAGSRFREYSYRMPAFGDRAAEVVQALAEADGELPPRFPEPTPVPAATPGDPTLGSLEGPALAGFQGYACVACHVWDGEALASPDPGAVGPDLTRTANRIRRDWFDRFLEGPVRFHPGTPMPSYFTPGQPAPLGSILGGDARRQKDALWSYFALGKAAPAPRPAPPVPVFAPAIGEPPLVASIPLRLPGDIAVDALCVLFDSGDAVVYDREACAPRGVFVGAQVLRSGHGRVRRYAIAGTEVTGAWEPPTAAAPASRRYLGHDRLPDGVLIHWNDGGSDAAADETLRRPAGGGARRIEREVRRGGPAQRSSIVLPDAVQPGRVEVAPFADPAPAEGSLTRPGYRAIAYPRPKLLNGEDRLLPSALAADPRTGRVYVASMKLGEIFALDDPTDDGREARFVDATHGLFQEAYSLLAADGALYVLHRRALTRLADRDGDGLFDEARRIIRLEQSIADDYDYGYGLVRDPRGRFVWSHAPHAHQDIRGSGGVLRLSPGEVSPVEVAFGLRNPLGWCLGPGDEVFCTDNQGEWVAANKLCHIVEGRFYGYPNTAQKEHASKPAGKAAVWVPYAWAKSINGVTYDATGGKFGPFAGQLFIAELMFGGAIVRASLEQVNGESQGACFPFWGKGLLGPVVLAFDPRGRLFVGSITEPGWMSQPDRGALFRIDFTGDVPFEMATIRIRPRGFRIELTRPASRATALDRSAYRVERYRYEYTGAYGSPEFNRTDLDIERIDVASDDRSIDLTLGTLRADHVYRLHAPGLRSAQGEPLVHDVGAYTVNEIPTE